MKKSIFQRVSALWLLSVLLQLLPLAGHAANVQATVDRQQLQLGETVTLNIVSHGVAPSDLDPDTMVGNLDALGGDFVVAGLSHATEEVTVNGSAQAQLTLGIALRPKHTGELTIPSLNIAGGTTSPITVQVDAADNTAPTSARGGAFLEATIEPSKGYEGQELQYVLRLYYTGALTDGSLENPQADGMNFLAVGNELSYDVDRGGQHYHVIERHYAATPRRTGKLVIAPVQFQGASVDDNDPNIFYRERTPLSASTRAMTVTVEDIPADADKRTWLPVSDLKLTAEGLPVSADARVGQPLNLTMLLQATGTSFESLPALSLPSIDGASVYPDKPLNGTRADGASLVARRQQSFVIVPNRPGTLVIPEITVHWWNVTTNKPEVARLPEQRLTVLSAAGQPAAPASAATAASAASTPQAARSAPAPEGPWRWIALASIGLWLVSMVIWWVSRRRPDASAAASVPSSRAAPVATRQLRAAFLAAAQGSDATRQAGALMAWAKAERPSLQNLSDLAAALGSLPQREAIAALQRRRYGANDTSAADRSLAGAFGDGFVWKAPAATVSGDGLPALYPFDVHGKPSPPQD